MKVLPRNLETKRLVTIQSHPSILLNSHTRSSAGTKSIQSLSRLESLSFGNVKKAPAAASPASTRATFKERFNFAEDNTLVKKHWIDFVVTTLAKAGEYFKPVKAFITPVLMVRWAVLYAVGLFTASDKIKAHHEKFPRETREVRNIAPMLWERCEPKPPEPPVKTA